MKKQEGSIRFNYIMNMIYTVSGMLFSVLIYPYAARKLGETGIGAVSFANSIVSCFGILAQLGIPTYGIKACAQVRDDREKLTRVVRELLLINLITCALTYLVFFGTVVAVPRLRQDRELFLVMGSVLFFNTIGVEWLYKGLEKYRYLTVTSLVFKGIALAGTFLLIRSEADYVIYGGITIFALAGSGVLNFLNLRKYIGGEKKGARRGEKLDLKRHLHPIVIFLAMSVATTIYTNMDSAMLGFMKGSAENGYYDVAVKVKNILVSVLSSLGAVLLPRMSFYLKNGWAEEFQRVTRRALRFILELSAPVCLYFILFADTSVHFLVGGRFSESVRPMQIIMPTVILIGLTNVIGMQMMVPLGKERQVLHSEVAGALVNLVVNAALIPGFGCSGAAIGTVAAEVTVLLVQTRAMRERVLPVLLGIPYGKLLAALVLGTAASLWTRGMGWGNFVTLAVSAVLFFGGYVLTLLALGEEMARELWQEAADRLQHKKGA